MLILSKSHLNAMVEHAMEARPVECCGVIAGPRGDDVPLRWIPMENTARSEAFFQFSPREQLQVWREMERADEEPVVIYHSHTHSQAYPSREDIQFAHEPSVHYVIIEAGPLDLSSEERVRSFRIVNQRVIEETVRLVDPLMQVSMSTALQSERC